MGDGWVHTSMSNHVTSNQLAPCMPKCLILELQATFFVSYLYGGMKMLLFTSKMAPQMVCFVCQKDPTKDVIFVIFKIKYKDCSNGERVEYQ